MNRPVTVTWPFPLTHPTEHHTAVNKVYQLKFLNALRNFQKAFRFGNEIFLRYCNSSHFFPTENK